MKGRKIDDEATFMANNPSRHLPNGQTILSIITYDDLQKRF